MLSTIPADLDRVERRNIELEAIRAAIIAELDAISLYEQLAANATDPLVKKVFLDVAREEKTHAGEFTTLLLHLDEQQKEEMENGRKEVEELSEEK
jgi:rubrerythrin